eukprot:scaffold2472_cov65-Phaeocystis_antarctica.AAC.4
MLFMIVVRSRPCPSGSVTVPISIPGGPKRVGGRRGASAAAGGSSFATLAVAPSGRATRWTTTPSSSL